MFTSPLNPVLYPAQIVTGGGRGSGFKALQYVPWSMLPTLKQTSAWDSLLVLYDRLAASYDRFYGACGFLSPRMTALIEELRKSYTDSYLTSPFPPYTQTYPHTCSDIAEAYADTDYSEAYALLLNQSTDVT
jgi:hypothetical protein